MVIRYVREKAAKRAFWERYLEFCMNYAFAFLLLTILTFAVDFLVLYQNTLSHSSWRYLVFLINVGTIPQVAAAMVGYIIGWKQDA